jgi:hypothetical protein
VELTTDKIRLRPAGLRRDRFRLRPRPWDYNATGLRLRQAARLSSPNVQRRDRLYGTNGTYVSIELIVAL